VYVARGVFTHSIKIDTFINYESYNICYFFVKISKNDYAIEKGVMKNKIY